MGTANQLVTGVFVLLGLLGVIGYCTPTEAGQLTSIDAGRGAVDVVVPDGYDLADPALNSPLPLLLTLHDYSVAPSVHETRHPFEAHIDVPGAGFILVRPRGMLDGSGEEFWNATPACCDFNGLGPDDSGYLRALVEVAQSVFPVDKRQIHVFGFSNGGFMASRLACDHPDLFAAAVNFSGSTYNDESLCGARTPVHYLSIHGTDDVVAPYDGGWLGGGLPQLAPFPGPVDTALFWAGEGFCASAPQSPAPANVDLLPDLDGKETEVLRYRNRCVPDGSAEHWKIVGGTHFVQVSILGSGEILDYLFSHPKSHQVFSDKNVLEWAPVAGARKYNVYRGSMVNLTFDIDFNGLPDDGYGQCASDTDDTTDEIFVDTDVPLSGDGYFYLRTVIGESGAEGGLGRTSAKLRRPKVVPACP